MNADGVKEHFDNIVTPTVSEFMSSFRSQCDIRKSVLAAIVLNHMTDQLAELQEDKLGKKAFFITRERVEEGCPAAKMIRDISNITKHRYLTAGEKIKQRNYPGLFDAPFGEGHFAEASHVRFVDGDIDVSVPSVIKEVFDYWGKELSQLNKLST